MNNVKVDSHIATPSPSLSLFLSLELIFLYFIIRYNLHKFNV